MSSLSSAIRAAAKGRDYCELLSSEGATIVGFYIGVGAGEVVTQTRIDFKSFCDDTLLDVGIIHFGGMLTAGLKRGRYSNADGGITFSDSYGLGADQVKHLTDWIKRIERLTRIANRPQPRTAEPRLRLSCLAA